MPGGHAGGVEAGGCGAQAAILENSWGGEEEVRISLDAARERLRNVAGLIVQAREDLLAIKGSLLPSRCEHSHRDLDDNPSVSTEIRTVIDCVLRDSLDPAVRDLRDAADYQPRGLLRSGLNLQSESEETRKALYDLVVRDNFPPEGAENPDEEGFLAYTPEEAGLQVFFAHGRYAEFRIMPSTLGPFAVSL